MKRRAATEVNEERPNGVTAIKGSPAHCRVSVTCGACGKLQPHHGPLVRYNMGPISGSSYWFPYSICLECADALKITLIEPSYPCDQCGRPVFSCRQGPARKFRTLCSKQCGNAFYRKRRRRRRRLSHCRECDAVIERKRSDIRYCSPACRLKAYRRLALGVTHGTSVLVRRHYLRSRCA
jgi:hypothetical protein